MAKEQYLSIRCDRCQKEILQHIKGLPGKSFRICPQCGQRIPIAAIPWPPLETGGGGEEF